MCECPYCEHTTATVVTIQNALETYVCDYCNKEFTSVCFSNQTHATAFAEKVKQITDDLAELLISKNKKYGNSALDPIRVFSSANPTEQLLVRLDDKLSRIKTQHITEDEDVLEDLLGYLVLLKISINKD